MSPNPLDDVSRGLQVLRDRLRQTAGADPVDWVADQLRKPLPPLPLEELQAELDSLVGLETVKEQVRALVAFLRCWEDDDRAAPRSDVPLDRAAREGAPGRGRSG